MRSQVRVAVIGGGVVGCSVLYHLTKLGWRDVVLLERDELTSRLQLACRGRHAHPEQRSQRRQAPGLHDPPLPRDRAGLGPVLRHPSDRRHHARRHARPPRFPQDRARAPQGARPGQRVHLDRGGEAPASADRGRAVRRRPVRPVRGPRRSVGRHPRLRQGGAPRRRRDPSPDAGGRAEGRGGRRLAGGHAGRHDQGRGRGQRRGLVGARGRPPGRARAASARDGAPLPGDRGPARGPGAQ